MKRSNYAMGTHKVAIIGVGFAGASIAYALTIRSAACEIVLIDINAEKAASEAQNIRHGIPFMGKASLRADDYSDCTNCVYYHHGGGKKQTRRNVS